MNKTTYCVLLALGLVALVTTGCISPDIAGPVVDQLGQSGKFTADQLNLIRMALTNGDGNFWGDIATEVTKAVGILAMNFLGIRVWRGSPSNRKGLPPLTASE
tara:strand:- start:8799 stop:9107 length:309 start_codon:yes stop_codon:yes gene_type:complete